jgi:hypothetical protein
MSNNNIKVIIMTTVPNNIKSAPKNAHETNKTLEIPKTVSIGLTLALILSFKYPNIDYKENFIIYKFYIFFIVFAASFLFDIISNNYSSLSNAFSMSVFVSMISVIIYSIFTDLSLNGFMDNFDLQRDKIFFYVLFFLVIICSINLIYLVF